MSARLDSHPLLQHAIELLREVGEVERLKRELAAERAENRGLRRLLKHAKRFIRSRASCRGRRDPVALRLLHRLMGGGPIVSDFE